MVSEATQPGRATADSAAQPELGPVRWWILAACCLVGFAKLAEPRLYVIGLQIPFPPSAPPGATTRCSRVWV